MMSHQIFCDSHFAMHRKTYNSEVLYMIQANMVKKSTIVYVWCF